MQAGVFLTGKQEQSGDQATSTDEWRGFRCYGLEHMLITLTCVCDCNCIRFGELESTLIID